MTGFDGSFVDTYPLAFQELVSLGSNISQRNIIGKESDDDEARVSRLLKSLQALDCSTLTAKETEALSQKVNSLLESQFVPTVTPIYSV